MKYLFILLAIVGFAAWWWQTRKATIRERLRREQRSATLLERCPKCGVFAPRGSHTCG